jgi:hypothetical protein
MADDKTKTAEDHQRIKVHEDYEVSYWTEALGVTRERLEQLVKDHGDRADGVVGALGKRP